MMKLPKPSTRPLTIYAWAKKLPRKTYSAKTMSELAAVARATAAALEGHSVQHPRRLSLQERRDKAMAMFLDGASLYDISAGMGCSLDTATSHIKSSMYLAFMEEDYRQGRHCWSRKATLLRDSRYALERGIEWNRVRAALAGAA